VSALSTARWTNAAPVLPARPADFRYPVPGQRAARGLAPADSGPEQYRQSGFGGQVAQLMDAWTCNTPVGVQVQGLEFGRLAPGQQTVKRTGSVRMKLARIAFFANTCCPGRAQETDRKSTRLNSSHV